MTSTIEELFEQHLADIDSEPFAHEDFWVPGDCCKECSKYGGHFPWCSKATFAGGVS